MAKPPSVDAFLAALPDDQRKTLETLRATLRGLVPKEAEETVNYGVPMLRLDGKNLVGFGVAKGHFSLFPCSPAVLAAHLPLLTGFTTTKGSIQFTAKQPIPKAVLANLVKARAAEIRAKG